MLFLAGAALFAMTFVVNTAAELVRLRFRKRAARAVMAARTRSRRSAGPDARVRRADLRAHGEPGRWAMGGALALGIAADRWASCCSWSGTASRPSGRARSRWSTLRDGSRIAGEPTRSERFTPSAEQLAALAPEWRERLAAGDGLRDPRRSTASATSTSTARTSAGSPSTTSPPSTTPPGLWFFERRSSGGPSSGGSPASASATRSSTARRCRATALREAHRARPRACPRRSARLERGRDRRA